MKDLVMRTTSTSLHECVAKLRIIDTSTTAPHPHTPILACKELLLPLRYLYGVCIGHTVSWLFWDVGYIHEPAYMRVASYPSYDHTQSSVSAEINLINFALKFVVRTAAPKCRGIYVYIWINTGTGTLLPLPWRKIPDSSWNWSIFFWAEITINIRYTLHVLWIKVTFLLLYNA